MRKEARGEEKTTDGSQQEVSRSNEEGVVKLAGDGGKNG